MVAADRRQRRWTRRTAESSGRRRAARRRRGRIAAGGGGAGGTSPCQAVLALDRSCTTPADCFAGAHTTDCCGNGQFIGFRTSEQARFQTLEAQCDATYPTCGCPAGPPTADDGSRLRFDQQASVTCLQGKCTTFVPDCGQPCGAGTTCFSCSNRNSVFAACTTTCTDSNQCTTPALPLCQMGCRETSRASTAPPRTSRATRNEDGSRPVVGLILLLAAACSSATTSNDASGTGAGGTTMPGRTACGATTCDAATQDCCISGSWQGTCAAKGSCTSGALSCSSSASCSGGQVCCATVATDGRPTAACAAGPCPAYQLCARPADCTAGQPCAGMIFPGSPGVCDRCAAVTCNTSQLCCPSTGICCPAGSGSCCR